MHCHCVSKLNPKTCITITWILSEYIDTFRIQTDKYSVSRRNRHVNGSCTFQLQNDTWTHSWHPSSGTVAVLAKECHMLYAVLVIDTWTPAHCFFVMIQLANLQPPVSRIFIPNYMLH